MNIRGDAAEVALGEAQAVLALVQDPERRGRLADLAAAVQDGELDDADAQSLGELLELGLQSGRIRSVYGPEGEQAALKTYRRLPGGRALSESADEVTIFLSGGTSGEYLSVSQGIAQRAAELDLGATIELATGWPDETAPAREG